MKLETFFEKFELFADTPDAVAKMRELVLEMALQGKLSEQYAEDVTDPQWLELLHRIEDDADSVGAEADAPYEIPTAWRWTTLDALGETKPRNDLPDSTQASFVPMALIPAEYGLSPTHDVRPWSAIKKGYTHFQNNDVVMAKITPCFENGKSAVMNELTGGAGAGTTELHVFRRSGNAVLPEFVIIHLKSRGFITRGIPRMTGSAGQKRVPYDYFARAPFPLPPPAEQKRIVAKVDELMALCDRLEAQQQERETQHTALAQASLARFADAPTPANLDLLFHKSCSISPADLRKSIFTLAVQGKLVPQDPNDEPATTMLQHIEVEKKRLSESGELKADKKAWVNSSANPPHNIPRAWSWVRLQDVFEISRGGSPRPAGDPKYFGGRIPWITVGEITKDSGKYLTATATGLTEAGSERSRFINPGDLLLTNSGATLGVPKISKIRGCMNDGVAVLRLFHSFDLNDFAYLYLTHQTPEFRNVNQGMGQPNLNTPIIAGWYFPLPPISEQRRIVAKVDELMALVDTLETQLDTAHTTGATLMKAVVSELTAAA